MYQRIRHRAHLEQLQAGSLIIRYPLSGEPTGELNLSEPDRFDLYEVESVEGDNVRLLLRAGIRSQNAKVANASNAVVACELSSFIIKHNDILVAEENWWRA